jgi:DNA-binding transcriptional regulator YiaG
MTIIGRTLRTELVDALGIDLLRQDVRDLARDVSALRRALSSRGIKGNDSSRSRASSPAVSSEQVRALRRRLGETRKAFAARLKVSPSIVFMWESGRSSPRRAAIIARLTSLIGSTPALAKGLSTAERSRPVGSARRAPSAARRAALKLQGRYMGYVRGLAPQKKAQVKALREAKGLHAAIALAKKLAPQ